MTNSPPLLKKKRTSLMHLFCLATASSMHHGQIVNPEIGSCRLPLGRGNRNARTSVANASHYEENEIVVAFVKCVTALNISGVIPIHEGHLFNQVSKRASGASAP
jgi:hypothetical protein